MNDTDDIIFDEAAQKSKKKQPRRRKDLIGNEEDNLDALIDSTLASQDQIQKSSKKNNQEQTFSTNQNRPAQAINGWGEDSISFSNQPTATVRSHRRELGTGLTTDINNEIEIKPRIPQREMKSDDNDDEIPAIPDLEETNEAEDMAFQVADAPDVQVHQISTYKELDKELFKEKAFQFLEGNIDVSLLHCGLNSEDQITEEDDIIWDWSKLFTEVVSLLTIDNEPAEISSSSLSNFQIENNAVLKNKFEF